MCKVTHVHECMANENKFSNIFHISMAKHLKLSWELRKNVYSSESIASEKIATN